MMQVPSGILSRQRLTLTLITILFALALIGLGIMAFLRGINVYDESVFLTISHGILAGKMPYRDLWDAKPPGTYYLLALVLAVLGKAWWAPRLFTFLFDLLLVLVFILFARRHLPVSSVLLGATLICLGLMTSYGYQVNTFLFAAGFGALGLVIVYDSELRSPFPGIVFGLLTGFATLFNQIGLLYLLAYSLAYFLSALANRIRLSEVFIRLLSTTFFFCIPLTLTTALFALKGDLNALIEAVFFQPTHLLVLASQKWDALRFLRQMAISAPPLSLTLFLVALLLFIEPLHRPTSVSLAIVNSLGLHPDDQRKLTIRGISSHPNMFVWLMAGLGMFTAILRYQGQHWVGSIFPFAFLAAILVTSLDDQPVIERNNTWKLIGFLPILALVVMVSVIWAKGPLRFIQERRIYIDMQQGRAVYEELSRCLTSEGSVLVVSHISPRTYYLSQHFPPWRWLYIDESNFGLVSWSDALHLIETGVSEAVLLETTPGTSGFIDFGPRPFWVTFDKIRSTLSISYRSVSLHWAHHPIHNTKLELFISENLPCGKAPEKSPLFP